MLALELGDADVDGALRPGERRADRRLEPAQEAEVSGEQVPGPPGNDRKGYAARDDFFGDRANRAIPAGNDHDRRIVLQGGPRRQLSRVLDGRLEP